MKIKTLELTVINQEQDIQTLNSFRFERATGAKKDFTQDAKTVLKQKFVQTDNTSYALEQNGPTPTNRDTLHLDTLLSATK